MMPSLRSKDFEKLSGMVNALDDEYNDKDKRFIKEVCRLSRKYDCSPLIDAYASRRKIYILPGGHDIDS